MTPIDPLSAGAGAPPRRRVRRRHVLTTVLVTTCAAALIAAEMAGACSCAFVPAREKLQGADAAFVGTIVQRTQREPVIGQPFSSFDPVQLRFRVERTFKGDLEREVVVHANSSGASCGLSADVGDRLALFLYRNREGYNSSSCLITSERELAEAARKLPAARARGPVRFLVAGDFGKPGVIALDRRGRTLGYGPEFGQTVELDVCPGGRRTIETAIIKGNRRLYVRDLRSMRVLRSLKLVGEPAVVSCRSRDARHYVALVTTQTSDGNLRGRLIDVSSNRLRVLHRGPVSQGAIGTRFAWLVRGERQRSLTRVDLRSGADRDVATLGDTITQLAVSPDGRRVAVEDSDGRLRVLDGPGLRGSRARAGLALWTDRDTLVIQTITRGAPRMRVVNDRLRTIRALNGLSQRGVVTGYRGRLLAISDARRLSRIDPRKGTVSRLERLPAEGSRVLVAVGGETRVRGRARTPCVS